MSQHPTWSLILPLEKYFKIVDTCRMKIAIVNDIHCGKSLIHNGKIRAASHLLEDFLSSILHQIIKQHSVDFLVNLGDLIRSENKASDIARYPRVLNSFKNLSCPVLHLVGNHEIKAMTLGEVEKIWKSSGFDQLSYGIREFDTLRILWLGLEIDEHQYVMRRLPEAQLQWLRNTLNQSTKPAIVLTHCAIDDHNVDGNFFYEAYDNRQKIALFLENQDAVRQIISKSGCVKAVLQAHLHYFHIKEIDGIPYITCPAMGDNICGPDAEDHIPEIYSILNYENGRFTLKAYSREYCFAGYEGTAS